MTTTPPEPDRPHYSGGTPVPDSIDSSTRQYSRGMDPVTGVSGSEPTEPVPTIASKVSPAGNLGVAGGTVVTLSGDNLGGSTGVTVGGTAATAVTVLSETQIRFTAPAKAAGTYPVVVVNPAGNSAGFNVTYA